MSTDVELIERPRCAMRVACEVAAIEQQTIRNWRKFDGLRIGKLEAAGWRFSALDVGEMCILAGLRAMGFSVADCIALAREQRSNLRSMFLNRLFHGFWSKGGIEQVDHATGAIRVLYLDQIVERVIRNLALPLPAQPLPKNHEIAVRMVDAIFDYFESPPGMFRWRKWRDSVLERGGKIPFAKAAAELGAPEWFLRAVTKAEPRHDLIAIVAPRAPKVIERLAGVELQ